MKPMTAAERKNHPLFSGVLRYFPDALLEVARVSKVGNDQHNPGQPLHWDRSKSTDELDALSRHLIDAGTFDTDGMRHSAKVAWRALANLQKEIEAERQADAEAEFFYDPRDGHVAGADTSLAPTIPENPSDALRTAMEDLGFSVAPTAPAPFIPMTFINKPNTETFGPEYEDDGFVTADADAGGVREVEPFSDEDHVDQTPAPETQPIRMRSTSGDIPSWAIRS